MDNATTQYTVSVVRLCNCMVLLCKNNRIVDYNEFLSSSSLYLHHNLDSGRLFCVSYANGILLLIWLTIPSYYLLYERAELD